ncbi:HNH endonuclease [Fundicoccus ignavus]|uniref:HNH endonuclease n=1 Tax=Fundicoccus ignavus TaxID=2664442 RepID=A0A844C9F9_9LACT|nr:HNH endonuclease [Fundicoccus ignavus]MRJ47087.1 HNH endonuclease [Fundicoccus ignavus]
MDWIISANGKIYDHSAAFERWGFIDWRQTANYEVGDTIYIYCTVPIQKVMYKTVVEKTNMTSDEIVNDEIFWFKREEYIKSLSYPYSRLKLIKKIDTKLLSLDNLKENGLKAAPQGPTRSNSNLSDYIESCFRIKNHDIIYPENDVGRLKEGSVMSVTINSYERNSKARKKCIEHYGISCQVCGMNFEEVYGQLGEGYIHVHHIVPLYKIGEEYEVDPINDLIPVCPNCHAMLHTKINGKPVTISELKEKFKQ